MRDFADWAFRVITEQVLNEHLFGDLLSLALPVVNKWSDLFVYIIKQGMFRYVAISSGCTRNK